MVSFRRLVLTIALAAGCSQSHPSRAITGQLDVTQFHLAGAQLVAMSSSGKVYRAAISPTGSFRILLPTHVTYTLRFANATTSPTLFDAFAVLAPAKVGGTRTHWITLTEGADINLGKIGKPGTIGPTATVVREDGSSDGTDSEDGEEDDGAQACDLSSGSDMEDVDSEHDALDDTDSDHDGVADSQDSSDDRDACASASDDGDDCRLTDGEEHDDDSEHDSACTPGGGGPAPVPGVG